jgi:hypothetical protein
MRQVRILSMRIDDLETPALMIKAFANSRRVTEPIESEARGRVERSHALEFQVHLSAIFCAIVC